MMHCKVDRKSIQGYFKRPVFKDDITYAFVGKIWVWQRKAALWADNWIRNIQMSNQECQSLSCALLFKLLQLIGEYIVHNKHQ
jgi:hypothetical protein